MGFYWGIHTQDCPSIAQLKAMAQQDCHYIGYYLAPTRNGYGNNTSYLGKRSAILEAGLNPVPLYMADSYENNVGVVEGAMDALDAVTLAKNEGFKEGTYIYLDIEKPCAPGRGAQLNYHAYIRRWVEVVNEHHFKAGIYISAFYAIYFNGTIGFEMETRYWLHEFRKYVGCKDTREMPPSPSYCGNFSAYVWKCIPKVNFEIDGETVCVDLNTSYDSDPAKSRE